MNAKIVNEKKKRPYTKRKQNANVKLLPSPENQESNLPTDMNIVDPQMLIMTAVKSGASIEVLERLMNMRSKLRDEQAEVAFREAMSRFQAECPIIPKSKTVKNKDGKTTRYKYAPLDTIIKAVQPFLAKNGLSYEIKTAIIIDPPSVSVTVKAFHEFGHSSETVFSAPVDPEAYMNAPQKWASAQTFAKRYAFCNAFGILTGDEDNDAGSIPPESQKDESKEKARQEALGKINALPDSIKRGFEILDYEVKTMFIFCQRFGWDHEKIRVEINKIIDSKEQAKS